MADPIANGQKTFERGCFGCTAMVAGNAAQLAALLKQSPYPGEGD